MDRHTAVLSGTGASMEEAAGTSPKGQAGSCGQKAGRTYWEGAFRSQTGTMGVGRGGLWALSKWGHQQGTLSLAAVHPWLGRAFVLALA